MPGKTWEREYCGKSVVENLYLIEYNERQYEY